MPAIAPEQREEAARRLERISRREFRRDLEDNLLHQGWLRRWLDIVPAYIDWCIARCRTWRPAAVEQRIERALTPGGVTVKGRLDRIDRHDGTHAIVDYKTGAAPAQEEVEDGEAVQLPFYALLSGDAVVRSEYLLLEKNGVRGGACLEDEDLIRLAQATGERLASLVEQMEDGAPLPAWGDEKTCDYCPVSGVCRKQAWDAPHPVIDHEAQANDIS